MRVWGQQLWTGEHSHHPRLHQDSHLSQRDKGSSAAASPTHSIQHKRLQCSQGGHHGVLQDNGIILKDATTTELRPQHCKSAHNIARSSTNGHRRSLQQQWHKGEGKEKKGHQKGKGKHQGKGYKQLLQQQRERKSIQRSIKRKRKVSAKQHERKRKIKRKGHMLQMWATRPHCKELPSCSVQRWQRWASTMGGWPIIWLVSRPVSTSIWPRMVQPRLDTTRIWARVSSTSSILAVTTTSIDNTNRHGTVHQCNGGHLHSNRSDNHQQQKKASW